MQAGRDLLETYATAHDAFAAMALIQSRFGTTSEAEACWRKSLGLKKDFVDAHHALGDIALERGDYDQAEQYYRETLRLDPNRPDAHHRLAEALTGNGKMAEAVTLLENRLETAPGDAETYFWLGQACLQLKDYEKAAKYHQASIDLDPRNTYSYYGLATACTRLGRKEQARKYLEEFRRLKAADQKAEVERMANADDDLNVAGSAAFLWSVLAEVYARHGDVATAEQYWRKAGALHPGDVLSRERLVSLFGSQQRFREAIAVMEDICRIRPADGAAFVTLGVLHARRGDFNAAEKAFRDAIRVTPNNPAGYVALARLYIQAERKVQEALKLAQKAAELEPIASHFMVFAEAAEKNGDTGQAKAAVRRAMELEPNNVTYKKAYESLGGDAQP